MRRYVQTSGAFFVLLAAVQLTRTVLGWPVQIDGVTVPVWVSGVAFVVVFSFALWAYRTAKNAA